MTSRFLAFVKESPFAAAVPFMGMMVLASYGMSFITQTKYDIIDSKQHLLDKKEELEIEASKEPVDIRKIYFDLAKTQRDRDWDFVRVPRPSSSTDE